jgi:hypothetical protein
VHVLGLGFVPGLVLVHVPLLVPAPAPALVPAVVTGTGTVFFPPLSRNEAMRSLLLTNFEPWKTDKTQSQSHLSYHQPGLDSTGTVPI